jgi:hypothetical protein
MTASHPLSILSSDVWCYSLSFIDDDDLLDTISHIEGAFPSPDLMECTDRHWKHAMEQDEAKINSQWKAQDEHVSARWRGREFLQAKRHARHLSQQSSKVFRYDLTPVPFFCQTPLQSADSHHKLEMISPTVWPFSFHQTMNRGQQQYVFVNVSQHTTGEVLWEGFRPLDTQTDSSFQVSWNIPALLLLLLSSDHPSSFNTTKALEMHYHQVAKSHGSTARRDFFDTASHHDEDGRNDNDEEVAIIPLSKCEPLATLMRRLQVTILYNHQLVVTTGGSQSCSSPLCGRFHDRQCRNDMSKKHCSCCATVSTTLEFHIAESSGDDRLCIKVFQS